MSEASLRPYAGAVNLRRMQDAVSPRSAAGDWWHVGDLAWAVRDCGHVQLAPLVTLVESTAGELLGWVWSQMYGWFDAVTVTEDDLPDPVLPEGLRLSGVEDEALVDARVEAHRAAFAPSRLTLEGFQRVRRTWPYRPELDRVVVDGEGRVLAACLAWLDEATGWGMLEPVGTRPEQQRRGLGAAVCLDALHALKAAGAHAAQVSCAGGSAGCETYHSIGFVTERRMRIWSARGIGGVSP